jgi:membrane protease YdiL (CAAX protease family)
VLGGSVAVTVLFALLHLSETFRYWPALVAITVMAIATLSARLLSRGLIPAMVMHLGYDARR